MFAFFKLFFCHGGLENVSSIDAFQVVPLPAAKQKIFNHNSQNFPFFR